MPIACRVCDMVFFDNVSLVLHFECHVNDGYRLRARDLASLQSEQRLSSSGPPCSYSALARRFQRMNDCLRSDPLPVPSETTPNRTPRDPNLLHIPELNASQPIKYSEMDHRNFDGGQMRFPVHKNQEIIVISDDEEEDENKSSVEIDLTLKL
ncbi:hypothetical protein SASPL_147306 [Salvia splendens]|uniref:C2H2-type domain-containing protein n=1 Tax=Salvia splendens TaxID=180675 RepID=A0A8X8WFK4_SALSN|nr:hypothetical protein SASPL_147306 [Salvia splendens]